MKTMIMIGLLLTASASVAAAAPVAKDESFRDAEGHRVLRESIVVAAPPADVWKAFTTDAGFMAWAVPLARITPGNSGMMESAFSPMGKIGDPRNIMNRIDVYLPDALLVIHNEHVPAGGPIDAELYPKVRTILSLEPTVSGTAVTETVVGFGDGSAFDALYSHLHDGNAEYLVMLANYLSQKDAGSK
jgi:uncharacterized protein YndB with AHSA1/START domain